MKLPNYRISYSRDIECCPALAQEDNTFSWEKLRFKKKKIYSCWRTWFISCLFWNLIPTEIDRTNEDGTKEVLKAPPSVFKSVRHRKIIMEKKGFQNTLDKSLLWKHCPFTKESEPRGIWITSSFFPQELSTLTLARGELREQLWDRESLRNYSTAFVLAGITQLQIWSLCPIMLVVLVIIICLWKLPFPLWLLPTWISWGHSTP